MSGSIFLDPLRRLLAPTPLLEDGSMSVQVPAFVSYDALLESIQMKLETGDIGSDTEYLADLIITLEQRIRLTECLKTKKPVSTDLIEE